MTLFDIVKDREMKITVLTIRSKKLDTGEFEETEQYSSVYADDVMCLYKDRKGVFLLLKKGTLMKVKHTIKEMEGYFFGDLTTNERAY